MEGLRGFAVLLVFLVHYESLVTPWIAQDALLLAFADSSQAIGNCGVDLFFLLSGYLIYGSLLGRRQSFPQFFAFRVPAFTVVFLTYVVLTVLLSAFDGGPLRLIMFISGIVLYEAITNSQLRVSGSAGVIALIGGLACALLPLPDPAGTTFKVVALFVSVFVFGLACFRTPRAWLPVAFTWTPLRWLGNMSYSFYLLHGLALKAGFMVLARVVPPTGEQLALHWILLLPMLALALIPSTALFLLIERPFSLTPRSSRAVPELAQAESAAPRP